MVRLSVPKVLGRLLDECAVTRLRALRCWRRLTDSLGLIMAIAAKRSLGSFSTWVGVVLVASLGLVVVPAAKLMRAGHAGVAARALRPYRGRRRLSAPHARCATGALSVAGGRM